MSDFDEIISEFLVECFEGLDQLDGEFVALEVRPDDQETLSSIFRTIHSIKGASGFLEFHRLEKLTHAGENLLDALRSSEIAMREEIASALLELNDAVRQMLGVIETTGSDEGADDPSFEELRQRLEQLLAEGNAPAEANEEPDVAESSTPAAEPVSNEAGREEPAAETPAPTKKKAARKKATGKKAAGKSTTRKKAEAPAESSVAGDEPVAEIPTPTDGVAEPAAKASAARRESSGSAADSSIRVRVDHLDALMNLAGELVLARNQIIQHAAQLDDPTTTASAQRLNHITSELQERVMKIRMQPIGLLWSKLPRIVRDLAGQLGKKVELELEGAETELDKTLLEAIKDPLTHLVRNALDHGIEEPEARESAGKTPVAKLRLVSSHQSGQVTIVIEDDGRGIDLEKIRAKAVEKGVITQAQAQNMDDRAAMDLLFAPGFSTASQITNVSGRGVGMDVVRSNLERVGGTVSIESELGKGTRVLVRIPLTLAIIPALTIRTGGERYAIPQANLVELVRVEAGRDERIEMLHGKPVFRLRGRLLPLLDLNDQLGVERNIDEDARSIVVVHAVGQRFGLLVDEILETEEIVVKPLGRHVKALNVYAGTTILGDGRVALILDIAGICTRARLMPIEDLQVEESSELERSLMGSSDESLVIFDVGGSRRMAVELGDVARLEEIPAESVEVVGRQPVVQYRGNILPLLDLDQVFTGMGREVTGQEPVKAIVQSTDQGTFGIMVDDVVDIVSVDVGSPRQAADEMGVSEVVVAGGKVTELLDVPTVAARSVLKGASSTTIDAVDVLPAETATLLDQKQICTFRLGGAFYGIDVLEVQEVLRPELRTPIPLASTDIEGLINLRGETVVLLDLRQRLGLESRSEDATAEEEMHVVVRVGSEVVSILVDEIGEVLELPDSAFEPCPSSMDEATRHVAHGVYKIDGELLLMLNVESIAAERMPEFRDTSASNEDPSNKPSRS